MAIGSSELSQPIRLTNHADIAEVVDLNHLPTSEDLPCSDETPVDNEIQNLVPNRLFAIARLLWCDRLDWFFAVDMALYYLVGNMRQTALVPDAFLCLGVARFKGKDGRRLSYLLWEEDHIPPIWVLEIVSQTYRGEYEDKKERYAALGVKYYTIYNPNHYRRDNHQPLEVYKLIEGQYVLQEGEPFWMPEIGLGIGRRRIADETGIDQEWLYWFNPEGIPHMTPDEKAQFEAQLKEQERQRADQEYQRRQEIQSAAIAHLLATGLTPAQVAEVLGLSLEEVRDYIH